MNQILNGFINFKVIRFAVSYIDHTFVFMQNNCGLIDLHVAIPFHPTPPRATHKLMHCGFFGAVGKST